MAKDRKCIVCPDKHIYKYCSHCAGYNSKETWRYLYCSQNCRGIYNIATDFSKGKISELEAKKELEKYDLSDLEFFNSTIKNEINEILSFEEIIKEESFATFIPQICVTTEDVNDEIKIESFTTTITVEDEIKEIPRKRKNKKNNIVNVD